MTVDYKDAVLNAGDIANRALQGMTVSKSARFGLIQTPAQAQTIAQRELRKAGYPLAELSFTANRKAFRLEPGDLFKFSYDPYGISQMVFRVLMIREKSLEKEEIEVSAIEAVEYLSSTSVTLPAATEGEAEPASRDLEALTHVKIVESPYAFGGETVAVICLAAREIGFETGYVLTMSVDGGSSFLQVKNVRRYCPYGTLAAAYSAETYRIDDSVGISIDFTNDDVDEIETVDRSLLFGSTNLALLGDEIISFQTITPDEEVDGRYLISGIYRGRFDTEPADHAIGAEFYFIGSANAIGVADEAILLGSTRQFKAVPYAYWGSGLTADASEIEVAIAGRALTPYTPANLRANDGGYRPTYTADIVLTWWSRVRGSGAGQGDALSAVDEAQSWEGYFKVEVYSGATLKRTTTGIDAATWTYSSAMNISDNGSLASALAFKVYNYQTVSGITYTSAAAEIIVRKQ